MKVETWDIPSRILHWSLALCIVLNLFVVEDGGDPHEWIGYAAVLVVLSRFFWGFKGTIPARPNRLASLVYAAIWLLIIGIGVSGWMMGTDAYFGEDWVEELHIQLSDALQGAVLLHFCGIAADTFRHRKSPDSQRIRAFLLVRRRLKK